MTIPSYKEQAHSVAYLVQGLKDTEDTIAKLQFFDAKQDQQKAKLLLTEIVRKIRTDGNIEEVIQQI